jgi:hypothetical protein
MRLCITVIREIQTVVQGCKGSGTRNLSPRFRLPRVANQRRENHRPLRSTILVCRFKSRSITEAQSLLILGLQRSALLVISSKRYIKFVTSCSLRYRRETICFVLIHLRQGHCTLSARTAVVVATAQEHEMIGGMGLYFQAVRIRFVIQVVLVAFVTLMLEFDIREIERFCSLESD